MYGELLEKEYNKKSQRAALIIKKINQIRVPTFIKIVWSYEYRFGTI